MLALGVLVAAGGLMWAGHALASSVAGRSSRSGMTSERTSKGLKQTKRVITNVSITAAVAAYPLMRGAEPLTYYGGLLPLDGRAWACLQGFFAAVLYMGLMFLGWVATDNLRFRIRHRPGRLASRLAAVPFSAALGALTEELLFRGMVVADLLDSLGAVPAVAIGALVFAGAHYLRRVKRYWTFAGHLVLGGLLCATFVWTRALWLPIGLHAGGILLTLGTRPFVRYTGPAWLVGASVFPYAGAVGMLALVLLTISMWLTYGGSL